MYEFIALSQLMQEPAHGYLIAKIMNDIIGPYARISPGRLYPLLAKLEQSGLIEAAEEDAYEHQSNRQLHIYKITDAGRMRFRVLMNDVSSSPGEYRELFTFKVSAFNHILPYERLRLIDHYIAYCQANIFHKQTELEDMLRGVARYQQGLDSDYHRLDTHTLEYVVDVMEHLISTWEHELVWARDLRARELSHAEQDSTEHNSTLENEGKHIHG